MNIYEFGRENKETILLIHPSVVKWDYKEDLQYVVEILKHCSRKTLWRTFDSCNLYNVSEDEAVRMMTDIDKRRMTNYRFYMEQKWSMARNYALSPNSSKLGYDLCIIQMGEGRRDYAKFGFVDEGVSDKSTHGNVVWHQMQFVFR